MSDERPHLFLVAIEVSGDEREYAEDALHSALTPLIRQRNPESVVLSWYVAEDDRHDGSTEDSAVFVSPGRQVEAHLLLRHNGLTQNTNDPRRERTNPYCGRRTCNDLYFHQHVTPKGN